MEGLILAYRAFVHLVSEYGNVLMMSASATQLSKLDSMQQFAEPLYSTQFVGTGLLCLFLYLLCYAAVLIKFTYYAQDYAQE